MTAKWAAATPHDTSAHVSVRIAAYLAAHELGAVGPNGASAACRLRAKHTSPLGEHQSTCTMDRTHSGRTRTPPSDRSRADHSGRSAEHRERRDRCNPFHVKHCLRAPPRPTVTGYRDPPLTGEPSLTRWVVVTLSVIGPRLTGPTHTRDHAIARPSSLARSQRHPRARTDTLGPPLPRLWRSHPRRRHNRPRSECTGRGVTGFEAEPAWCMTGPPASLSGRLVSKRGAERASATHRPTSGTTDT